MTTATTKLNEVAIKDPESGKELLKMLLPEGYVPNLEINRNSYRGYGQPFYLYVKALSPDKHTAIYYNSSLHYKQDFLKEQSDFTVDLYGNLHRKFMTAEDYIESLKDYHLKDYANIRLIGQTDWNSNEKMRQKLLAEEKNKEDDYNALGEVYWKGIVRQYGYKKVNTERRRVYAVLVKSVEHARWYPLPDTAVAQLNNPFYKSSADFTLSFFPNARFDSYLNQWIYTVSHYRDWHIQTMISMDTTADQFDAIYSNVFMPILNYKVWYTPQLRAEIDQAQKEIDLRNERKRSEVQKKKDAEKAAKKQAQKEADAKRERDRQFRASLEKTRKETEAIRKSTYENKLASERKTREIWSDTIRGDSRFTDQYGNEHVIHTYDRYAYKNGDTYVTSDSPLDHDYDWEELKPKKY